jgi:probable F420-dependent oxidoreductase
MKTHALTGGSPLAEFQETARRAAAAGFSGLVVTEGGRTAYLSCAAAALSGADLDIATGVAVAFPRSPTVTAAVAWELAEASGGRFRLGIGTQVRAHIERRYSAPFDRPGPRLRDYVLAVRALFAAFRGDAPLEFDSEHYRMSLLPPMWSPGPIPVPDPPIDIAAVNPWMLRMAGEVANGVHVHPLNTPTYHVETLLPNVDEGLSRSGHDRGEFALFVPVFTVVGDTEEERATWRETVRSMIGFYGSTPNYAFIFDQIGFPETTDRLRQAQKAGDLAGMSAVITDDVLSHFVVEGTWAEVPGRIVERMKPLRDHDAHVVLYLAGMSARQRGDTFERFGEVAKEIARLT